MFMFSVVTLDPLPARILSGAQSLHRGLEGGVGEPEKGSSTILPAPLFGAGREIQETKHIWPLTWGQHKRKMEMSPETAASGGAVPAVQLRPSGA